MCVTAALKMRNRLLIICCKYEYGTWFLWCETHNKCVSNVAVCAPSAYNYTHGCTSWGREPRLAMSQQPELLPMKEEVMARLDGNFTTTSGGSVARSAPSDGGIARRSAVVHRRDQSARASPMTV